MTTTNHRKWTEIEELLQRYERIRDLLQSLEDKRRLPLLHSIELSIGKIREHLNHDEAQAHEREILAGLRQGIRDLRMLMSWAPDGIVDRIVAIGEGRDRERMAILSKIIRNNRICNDDELDVVRHRRDEIAGDPDFEHELTVLESLLNRYENI